MASLCSTATGMVASAYVLTPVARMLTDIVSGGGVAVGAAVALGVALRAGVAVPAGPPALQPAIPARAIMARARRNARRLMRLNPRGSLQRCPTRGCRGS